MNYVPIDFFLGLLAGGLFIGVCYLCAQSLRWTLFFLALIFLVTLYLACTEKQIETFKLRLRWDSSVAKFAALPRDCNRLIYFCQS